MRQPLLHGITRSFPLSRVPFRSLSAALPLLFLATSCSSQAQEFRLLIYDDGFESKSIEIRQGETIAFENAGEEPHWPASNIHPTHRMYPGSGNENCGTDQSTASFDACRGLMPGESYTFTFDFPGVWRFHDHLNPELSGEVSVVEVEGAGDPPEPSSVPTRIYDDNIPEDSPVIFQDDVALYSYVRKYGAAKTIQYLYGLEDQLGDCHQAAHSTGGFAYEISEAQAFHTCSAECHSGCYHGATEAYFRDHGTLDLAADLAVICSLDLNEFIGHQCYHGVGHGLMAFSDYELFEALGLCDLIPGWESSCYSGVYMENVVGGLAQDQGHHTQYLNDDPHFPCSIVSKRYRLSCYGYQTSRMMQLFDGDFSAIARECSEVEDEYLRKCFVSMGRDVGGVNVNNIRGAINDCNAAAQGEPRNLCLRGAVQNFFWVPEGQDEALEFCGLLEAQDEKGECYDMIFNRAPLVIESASGLKTFCLKAEPAYQETCLQELADA